MTKRQDHTARLDAALAGRYRILEQIGEGGMATVYLADRLKVEKQLPVEEAVRIATAVANALDYAHRQGVVHRDIKPANILFQDGQPVVSDFGIALAVGAGSGTRLTETGLSLGTPFYMSPEQATGDQQVGPRSDIYSLGAVLHETLTGDPPYPGNTAQAVMIQILRGDPVSPAELRSSVPGNVDAAVRKALERLPADRFAEARDFSRALANPAFRHGIQSASGGESGDLSRRRWVGTVAAVVPLVALFGWWAMGQAGSGSERPPVIVLMDSTHPNRVYDSATIAEGGTNADDLTDALRDLPVVLTKENTNHTWNREEEVRLQNPALVVAHRSLFYNATLGDNPEFATLTAPMAWDKFDLLMAYIAMGNPDTRFLVYSRGSWNYEERLPEDWVRAVEARFPALEGRVVGWQVPLDRATFRDPATVGEIRAQVVSLLELETER
jgi:hypothetical protein